MDAPLPPKIAIMSNDKDGPKRKCMITPPSFSTQHGDDDDDDDNSDDDDGGGGGMKIVMKFTKLKQNQLNDERYTVCLVRALESSSAICLSFNPVGTRL